MSRMTMMVCLIGMLAAGAFAEEHISRAHPHPRRNQVARREHRQHHRIRQGVKSGELTKDEAKTLRTEQKEIREERHEMMSDGHLTKDEHKQLNQDLNAASQNIYEEKHDAEKR